jgi:hypothetical protein
MKIVSERRAYFIPLYQIRNVDCLKSLSIGLDVGPVNSDTPQRIRDGLDAVQVSDVFVDPELSLLFDLIMMDGRITVNGRIKMDGRISRS